MVIKFSKTLSSALVAHVDTLRAVSYAFRRADIAVTYSQGYNPHMELAFSSPIPLGVESYCEYVVVDCSDIDVVTKLNAVCPKGLHFDVAYNCNVNVASVFNRATYVICAQGIGNVIDQILAPNYCITYTDRGVEVTKDVSARIFSATKVDDNTAQVTFATGNDNLRPDRVVVHLQKVNNLQGDYSVTKTAMFKDDTFADEYLQNICNSQQ